MPIRKQDVGMIAITTPILRISCPFSTKGLSVKASDGEKKNWKFLLGPNSGCREKLRLDSPTVACLHPMHTWIQSHEESDGRVT